MLLENQSGWSAEFVPPSSRAAVWPFLAERSRGSASRRKAMPWIPKAAQVCGELRFEVLANARDASHQGPIERPQQLLFSILGHASGTLAFGAGPDRVDITDLTQPDASRPAVLPFIWRPGIRAVSSRKKLLIGAS